MKKIEFPTIGNKYQNNKDLNLTNVNLTNVKNESQQANISKNIDDNAGSICELSPEGIELYNQVFALNAQGNKLDSEGNHEEAIKKFDEAIAIFPNDPLPHANKAKAYVSIGKYTEATKSLDTALTLDPNCALAKTVKMLALNAQGAKLGNQGNHEEAIKKFDEAIAIFPNEPLLHVNKAKAYICTKDYANVIKSLDAVLTLDPTCEQSKTVKALALNAQGIELYNQGKHEEAIKKFDEAIAENNKPKYHANKAFVYNRIGKFTKVTRSSGDALTLDPDYALGIREIEFTIEKNEK